MPSASPPLQNSKATLHAELFKGLGALKDEYVIRLKPDAVPFSLSVPRRIPIPLLEVVRHELDKLESAGVIRRIDKPTPWCSGLVVVRKDDGSYRLFDEFVRGITFDVETDHLPLVSLLGKMELDMLPPRIQRLRLKTMQYQFRMLHVPGKLLATADALSRIAHKASTPVDRVELFAAQVVGCMSEVLPLHPEDVRQAQESDAECKALISFCQQGWPRKTKLPLHVSKYASVADELSVCDGILLKGPRIVIPSSLRPAVLTLLHEGHQGVNRTKALARESVWWPGISAEIASLVTNCEQCASTRVNLAEPLVSTALPGRPWEFLGMDLFHLNGQAFLLVVDYYSRFPEVVTLRSTTARAVIDALKSIFARHGIPQDVRSDNGPPFSSQELAAFAASYGFNHATSSPHYAQSNGEAERMLRPNWPPRKDVVTKDVAYKRKQTGDYNRHHGARDPVTSPNESACVGAP
ncbi:uncharacterized protein K02A2.6-like [Rhipicephalus sanguineus]|uniref:uncharacterized protein K02A2.6-like n=1 Tax=Rhipicephalus sanguineus TaxID=34632 RepID=UPI001893B9D0|nr:uncharacterized protein K02A2.6-like [Rhipicephalus sanguineus]